MVEDLLIQYFEIKNFRLTSDLIKEKNVYLMGLIFAVKKIEKLVPWKFLDRQNPWKLISAKILYLRNPRKFPKK